MKKGQRERERERLRVRERGNSCEGKKEGGLEAGRKGKGG